LLMSLCTRLMSCLILLVSEESLRVIFKIST
jgi:hypothetical protein